MGSEHADIAPAGLGWTDLAVLDRRCCDVDKWYLAWVEKASTVAVFVASFPETIQRLRLPSKITRLSYSRISDRVFHTSDR